MKDFIGPAAFLKKKLIFVMLQDFIFIMSETGPKNFLEALTQPGDRPAQLRSQNFGVVPADRLVFKKADDTPGFTIKAGRGDRNQTGRQTFPVAAPKFPQGIEKIDLAGIANDRLRNAGLIQVDKFIIFKMTVVVNKRSERESAGQPGNPGQVFRCGQAGHDNKMQLLPGLNLTGGQSISKADKGYSPVCQMPQNFFMIRFLILIIINNE